jgi:hypothetical protein
LRGSLGLVITRGSMRPAPLLRSDPDAAAKVKAGY